MLTVGEDSGPAFTGGAGNDVFNGPIVQSNAGTALDTLESFDVLNGGDGVDTLNATVNSGNPAPTLSNIELVNLRFTAGKTADLANSTGITTLTVAQSTAAATVNNIGAIASLAVNNQNQNVSIGGTAGTATTLALGLDTVGTNVAGTITPITLDLGVANASKATTANITANNAYVKVDSTKADVLTTATIAATGTNELTFTDSAATIKSATITGAGSVDLSNAALTAALTTFNASASEGAIKANIQSTVLATVTTGKGADLIDMDTAVVAGTTVNLGAGNDTLLTGALLGSFAKVDGGEGDADVINITDGTAALTAGNAKLITGFEVLDVSGGKNNYDVSLNNFATVQIDEAVNGALAGAVDFKNAADRFTLTVASKAKDNDFAVGQTIAVTGKDYTGTTALGTAETFTLVANMRDGDKDDTADGNINANTITVAGVEHLVVDAGVSTLDGGAEALNAAEHTLTVKFTATEAETLTVKGAGSVNITGGAATSIGVVTKVDATASTGNVTIDLATHAKSVAYFGSEGIDTYKASAAGDNIYTGKGADVVTLTNIALRDTFVLKAATDSQIGDNDKSGKITLAGDEVKGGVQMIDTISTFTGGGTNLTDRLDVTNFAFSGAQRGIVDVSASVTNATDLTSIADLFAAPAGDRGLAFSVIAGSTYVFLDANKDGNFTAADDVIIKLAGVNTGIQEVDVNF